MRRFAIAASRIVAGRVTFDREESRHLSRVLRLRPGDTVLASDGAGRDYTVRLEAVGDVSSGTVIATASAAAAESRLQITLLQGVPKGDKMETIVRAATELGVARVMPVLTERTIVRLESGRWRERARRWQRIAKEASKQCGRNVVPAIDAPRSLAEAFVIAADGAASTVLRLCLWEGEAPPLGTALEIAPPTAATLLVGPEGGLAEEEVRQATAAGFVIARAGPRIMRTETAGPALIAVLQFHFGDLAGAAPP